MSTLVAMRVQNKGNGSLDRCGESVVPLQLIPHAQQICGWRLKMLSCAAGRVVTALLPILVGSCLASDRVIGLAVATGNVRVNGNVVSGNFTVFDGSYVETGQEISELRLESGPRLRLASNTRARIFPDRLVLDEGLSELNADSGFLIQAPNLRIWAPSSRWEAWVAVDGRHAQVATVSGILKVSTEAGRTVAYVSPGNPVNLEPQAAGEAPVFSMTGCLERWGARFVIRDQIAGVVEEVRGQNLDGYVGSMVEVTATEMKDVKPVAGAEEVIQIVRIRRIAGKCAVQPATAQPKPPSPQQPPAPTQMPTRTSRGMSGAAKAVIAGVVVAGAGGGTALYFLKFKKEKQPATISR